MAEAAKRAGRGTAGWVVALAILGAALWPFLLSVAERIGSLDTHAPDWALWAQLPITVRTDRIANEVLRLKSEGDTEVTWEEKKKK